MRYNDQLPDDVVYLSNIAAAARIEVKRLKLQLKISEERCRRLEARMRHVMPELQFSEIAEALQSLLKKC